MIFRTGVFYVHRALNRRWLTIQNVTSACVDFSNFFCLRPITQVRNFGTKKVVQKRKHMMKILQPLQTPYIPKPQGYTPIPVSVLGSGPLRRIVNSDTAEAFELAKGIEWDKYKCDTPGVRWHPNGSWRVQFNRRNYEHNFHIKVNCYFRVGLYGFEGARALATGYRKRLEAEWDELNRTWEEINRKTARQRRAAKRKHVLKEASEAAENEEYELLQSKLDRP